MFSIPHILFLARRYPPSVGGIQTYAQDLYTQLNHQRPVKLIALGKDPLYHLAWFIPYAFFTALFHILFHKPTVVYFIDGVTAALAPFLRPFTSARFAVTIHGAELTFNRPLFNHLMQAGMAACDRVVVVSHATAKIAVRNGVSPQKMRVIYQGMRTPILPENEHRRLKTHFEQTHDLRLDETPFLLNYGRQVRRKGVADFIEKGFPLLRDDIRLFISGSGPMQDRISAVIKSLELQNRVFILGRVDDSMIAMLRREAQLFLMPNIHLSDDAEGFGIAPLECMYNGLPVVAFSVDALGESLGEAAFLVPPNDYPAFIKQIHRYLDLSPQEKERIRTNAQAYVRREYTWEKTTAQYMEVFEGKA